MIEVNDGMNLGRLGWASSLSEMLLTEINGARLRCKENLLLALALTGFFLDPCEEAEKMLVMVPMSSLSLSRSVLP